MHGEGLERGCTSRTWLYVHQVPGIRGIRRRQAWAVEACDSQIPALGAEAGRLL